MSTQLVLIGTNHEWSPISVRERLAVSKADLPQVLEKVAALPGITEAYILSTCNRTEVYLVGKTPHIQRSGEGFVAGLGGFAQEELSPYVYVKAGREAVAHLFNVAAGANSMVLGDSEVLGQIKESFVVAAQVGTLGKTLNALLRKALEVGKSARTQTKIGGKAASLSYAAIEVAKREMDIKSASALVVGAGKMGRLVGKILVDSGAGKVTFANRTPEKAQDLAQELGGAAAMFEELAGHLGEIDIAIAATEAPCFILRRSEIQEALQGRRKRPLVLIDLGIPRNIDDRAKELEGVVLFNVDDLQRVVQSNLDARREELKKVTEIVEEGAAEFMAWHKSSHLGPTIKALIEHAEAIRREEVQRFEGKLIHLSPQERNTVEMLTNRVINRLLHPPLTELKAAAASGDGQGLTNAARRLFHLEETS